VLSNLVLLSDTEHRYAHSHPADFLAWIISEIGHERFEELERARNWPELTLQQMEELVVLYRSSI
jgi:hypothetical protein